MKAAIGLALVASLGAAYAFKSLFARPGEAALRFVPADAMLVGSIDLSPSPQQALTFKHIDDALARNGMQNMLDGSVLDIFEPNNKSADLLKPLVLRNGAMALLPKSSGDGIVGLALLALSNGPEADKILQQNGKPQWFRGTKFFVLKNGRSPMMVMDDVLLIGEAPESLHRARLVRDGQEASITTAAHWVEARQRVASDANVMLFVNPAMATQSGAKALSEMKASWLAAGLAIRDGGIGLSVWNQIAPESMKGFADLAKTKELRRDLFDVLPSGAYGMVCLSQPGNHLDTFEAIAGEEESGPDFVSDFSKDLRQNTGLDLHQDVVAGLRGNAVVAAYPSAKGEAAGVDLLMVIDDMNGSDPASAVKRFQSFVAEQMEKETHGEALWQKVEMPGADAFRIVDKMQDDMREGMGQGMDPQVIRRDVLVDNKTVAWAMVDKAVIASSSEDLLKRAVASYRSRNGALSMDTGFIKSPAEVTDGSQILAVFNLSRIAQGMRNTLPMGKMQSDDRKLFQSTLTAFEKLTDPFYLKTKISPDGQVSVGAFIPLDYDQIIDFVGHMMKS